MFYNIGVCNLVYADKHCTLKQVYKYEHISLDQYMTYQVQSLPFVRPQDTARLDTGGALWVVPRPYIHQLCCRRYQDMTHVSSGCLDHN